MARQTIAAAVRAAKQKERTRPAVPAGPFQPGDTVQLKSGGFKMTVYGLIDTCARKGELVEVLWAHDSYCREVCRDTFPVACLQHVPRDLDDNIPF